MVKLSIEICLSNKMMFLPLHKISLVTILHSSILFLQILKKYNFLQTFELDGHFLIVYSLNTYTLVLLSQVLSDDGLHCSQLLYVSAMECPETSTNKSDLSLSSQYPA